MRIALVSDIHGNLIALEAIFRALKRHAPEQIISLGDVAGFGPEPHEVIAILREHQWPTVVGNSDHALLNPTLNPDAEGLSLAFQEIKLWGSEQLTLEDKAYLQTFQPTVEIELDGTARLLCYHGSPHSFHDEVLPTTPTEQLDEWFGGQEAICLAGGHTHQPMVRRYAGRAIINPGSVGLPYIEYPDRVRNPAWAEYALLDWDDGHLNIQLCCEPFDLDALLQTARDSGMPHVNLYCQDWA